MARVVLIGNLGGRLKTGGRVLQYPKYQEKGHRTISNLYITLLHAVDKPRERFGLPDIGLRDLDVAGPLNELI